MTTGEGGMIVTDNPEVESAARRFVDHGRVDRDVHVETGHNFRIPAVAAAVGRVQLQRLPDLNLARRRNAARLTDGLADTPLVLPIEPEDRHHVYHQYTVRTEQRDELATSLSDAGVGSMVYYPRVIPELPAYDGVSADCPVARRAAAEVLSVPVHPGVSPADVDRIVENIVGFLDE
jgi:dTDP-4-amino-4,6-dideoxygalactose transaminase